ncbi:MAG: murein biosynthesis integral membrane protein MurJ [Planctomycetota bacterium]|jgi:putative peptidoglycan lipid II flippase
MIKGFRQIASLTALSRVFGLIRDICYFYFFGAGTLLDAWFIAFKIPNLSRRLFGEGAASASLIPVYSQQLHKDPQQARRLVGTVVTVLFVLLAALILLGWVGIWVYSKLFQTNSETRLILSLTSIMLPYMLLVCIVAILAGILNVHRHFACPAAAPIVLNIFIIATVMITGWALKIEPRQQLFAVAVAVLIAGLVQIGIQLRPLRSAGVSIRPAWEIQSDAFRKIVIMMGPMILGLTATQINTLFDDLIAWWFSSSVEKGDVFLFLGNQVTYPLRRGCVSHLNAAQRLYQMPLGVFGISLATAIFPVMSSNAAAKDLEALKRTICRGIKAAIFIGIPATVGLFLTARLLVSTVFEHGKFTAGDTEAAALTLLFYASGLTGFFIQQIVTRAFYSMHDSRAPMHSALIAVCANLGLNLTLIWVWGTGGLACSTALCSYLQVVILVIVLRRKLGGAILQGMVSATVKTVAATIFMGAFGVALLALMRNLPGGLRFDILRLAAVVSLAAGAYLLAAKLLRIEMLSLLTGKKQLPTDD